MQQIKLERSVARTGFLDESRGVELFVGVRTDIYNLVRDYAVLVSWWL